MSTATTSPNVSISYKNQSPKWMAEACLPGRVEILDTKVLIPEENILVLEHYVRMQKSFGKPPKLQIFASII